MVWELSPIIRFIDFDAVFAEELEEALKIKAETAMRTKRGIIFFMVSSHMPVSAHVRLGFKLALVGVPPRKFESRWF